jgi:hypothetical protein
MHKAKRSGRNPYQVYGSGDESMALAAIPRERWLATGLPCLHRPASGMTVAGFPLARE